jgi:hypothetical protein
LHLGQLLAKGQDRARDMAGQRGGTGHAYTQFAGLAALRTLR